jgi:hypothetical protein
MRFANGGSVPMSACLAPGLRADGDALGNGSRLQVVEAGIGHPVQRRVFGVGDQQAGAFRGELHPDLTHPEIGKAIYISKLAISQWYTDDRLRPAGCTGRPATPSGRSGR